MLPTLLIIGAPQNWFCGESGWGSSAQCRKATVNARDYRTRQVAAIFRSLERNLRASLFMCDVSNASCSYLRFTFSKGSEWYRSSNGKGREKVLDVTEIKTNAQ